jgi:hypothetical protein
MPIFGCFLLIRCCQPAVAGGVIYVDLWGELNTHLARRLCLLRVLLGTTSTATSFPLSKHTGGGDNCTRFSQACVFVYSSRGKWVFPPLLWSFPPTAAFTSFPALDCWAHTPAPAGASLARPWLFIYSSEKDSPPPLFGAQGAPPSLQRVFLFLLLITQFLLFPRVEVGLSRWLCCSSPMLSVRLPWYRLAYLVRVFPSRLGMGNWWPRGPPGFSV